MQEGNAIANRSRQAALMGLLFALALALSALEGMLPAFFPVPGLRLGLSNVVTMYCVFVLGGRKAFLLAGLKSLFVLLVRGMSAALLSLCGGLLSVTVMLVLLHLFGSRLSYGVASICGAVTHNLGQLTAAVALLQVSALWYYLPVLVAMGVVMGLLTATVFRAAMPFLRAAPGK